MSAELPYTSANAQTCPVCGWHGATVGSSCPLRPGEGFETCPACGCEPLWRGPVPGADAPSDAFLLDRRHLADPLPALAQLAQQVRRALR